MTKKIRFTVLTALFACHGLFAQFQYVGTYAGSPTSGYVNGSLASARFNLPYGVTYDGNQTLFVADVFNHVIRKIDMAGGTVSTLAGTGSAGFTNGTGTAASFNLPIGLYYKNGFVYVADNSNHAVRKIDAITGVVTTVAGSGALGMQNGSALSASFSELKSLVVDDSGDIYVADYDNHVIRNISNGQVTTFAGTGAQGFLDGPAATAQFWKPRDLTFDNFGALYVADMSNNRIRKIYGGMVTTLAGSGTAGSANGVGINAQFNLPTGIEFHNGTLYIVDAGGNKIRNLSLTGVASTVAGSGASGYTNGAVNSATFNLMQDLTLDNNGNIYIGDRSNNCIRIVATTSNLLEGHVYDDVNSDCLLQGSDHPFTNWIVRADPGAYYASTNSNGYYSLPLPSGTYTVTQLITTAVHLWDTVCPSPGYTRTVTLTSGTTLSNQDFALHANSYCPILQVDVAAGNIRRCMNSWYTVQYSNIGNDTSFNAYVALTLDSLLSITTSSIPWTSQAGSSYTFSIGTLQPNQTGSFSFSAYLDCSAQIGSTRCVEAMIGPFSPCTYPVDSTWDHSSVKVDGTCSDSLACFSIENTGSAGGGDMQGSSPFRIYENGVLVYSGTFQLLGGTDTTICWPANGNTIQLQADQRPGHPGHSHPNAYVEDCGTPVGMTPVYGYVTSMPPDDDNYEVEIECIQVTGSFDPNDKTVVPTGIGPDHHIGENDELEYKIRFQNTGNDTAFTVMIRDTLSTFLDPSTVVSGASSHAYSFRIFGNGILEWTFANILLPDSNVNEPASHGFVKFKVKQNPNNPIGTLIENRVGIIFDYNDPVMTNTAFSTVWQDFTTSVTQSLWLNPILAYPNPSAGVINFEIGTACERWNLVITDGIGRVLQNQTIQGEKKTSADLSGYGRGVYFFKAYSNIGTISSGKVIVH